MNQTAVQSETPVTAPTGKPARLVRAALLAIVAFGILAGGIATAVHALRMANPPPAISASALPAGTLVAHPNCAAATAGHSVDQTHITVAHRDLAGFTRALHEWTSRQGGCYHTTYPEHNYTRHHLTLPTPAISRIKKLNSQNYSAVALRENPTTPGSGNTDFRHIDVYVTSSRHDPSAKWLSVIALTATMTGLVASIAAVSRLARTARSRPPDAPDAVQATPTSSLQT